MGCISFKNHKFIHQHSHFSLDTHHSDNQGIQAHPQLDLTQRNYQGHNQFILCPPSHFILQYRRQSIRLNSTIANSTILMRRIRSVVQNVKNQ